ncbi:hypothetical protein L1987_11185 [Smallanthus sonchifolius]|uniref:Uncharacterized protein n=1 Tax=Smallanthus sonchifolius TaxID=185202 RepID=A0ACB9JAT9_9ASTR|nr:hypothetical protein L1987_11185 [Smallanthus sonchifolius]
MPIDKSWLTNPNRSSPEYKKGLNSFIEMCKEQVDDRGYVRCACAKCQNSVLISFTKMKFHMYSFGFCRTYTMWSYHGESSIHPVIVVDDVEPRNDMDDVIEDVMGERMEEDTNTNEGNSGTESRGVRDDFEALLKEVQSELYPGCTKFSSLDFLAKLMHIKVKNKWTNSSFDELLELLQSSHPEGNKIPPSHYVTKKTLKKIGLGYESIHVCKNDCALFWKEHHSSQNCPVCNESRWVDTNTKGKKVAHKVLRYFPLTPRLRRLYCSRHTAKDMIWHNTGQSEEGTMRHPVDGTSWKEFDIKYPDFSREPRNVRLGLAADGFNPFGNMSSAHSTWPVVLTTYNLPPWLCMKESSFMLSLLIPGPKSPGKDMDVFLRPLVDELKHLWQSGVRTKDAATNSFFTMKAALLWTINDFPARSSLSGWSGQGYKACPTCNEDTSSIRVTNKVVYVGHRRFLDAKHPWRTSLDFNGEPETRAPPKQFSPADIEAQLDRLLHRLPGKHPDFGGVTRKREDFELNWSKRSIFFELEYWSSLQLKHNLDVMHIERNVCDSLLGTLLMNDKTKDTSNARVDLEKLKIRRTQWLEKKGNKIFRPHPKYSFKITDRKLFCEFIKDVKLPDGFRSNIRKRVTDNNTNITGLKSHDCHILMQRLIPIGVRGFLTKDTYTPIVDLCTFFKQLCSRTLLVEDMKKAKDAIITILCKLELIYPPAFFDIMVHLVLHLPDEAIRGGPVCMRWSGMLVYLMADVMGLGHGGDGAGDPPPPFGDGQGVHEMDLGVENDFYTREVGIFIWHEIALDKMSWRYVSPAEKNALNEHLKQKFDLDAIRRHALQTKLRGGLDANKTRLEAFHDAHTLKDGTFDNELAEQQYHELAREFELQTQRSNEEGSSSQTDDVAIFEKVLGARLGHTRGIGRKPPSSASSSFFDEEGQTNPSSLTQAQIAALFQEPNFRDELLKFMASNKAPNIAQDDGDEDDMDEGDGNDDMQ